MNSTERKTVREALKASGFERYETTYDPGNGMYTEGWVRKDGSLTDPENLENVVQIRWGVRTPEPPEGLPYCQRCGLEARYVQGITGARWVHAGTGNHMSSSPVRHDVNTHVVRASITV